MPDPSDLYRHRGTRAMQRMVEYAPSTGGLALWVRHVDLTQDAAQTIATDGNALYYGPDFDKLALAEQTGWVAHEVLHIALRHPQRLDDLRQSLGDVDVTLFNICADAIVNSTLSHLTWLTLPPSAVFLDFYAAYSDRRRAAHAHAVGTRIASAFGAQPRPQARDFLVATVAFVHRESGPCPRRTRLPRSRSGVSSR